MERGGVIGLVFETVALDLVKSVVVLISAIASR